MGTCPRICALVPAAGRGERAGLAAGKLYHPIQDRPLLAHTLAVLQHCDAIAEILLVLHPEDESRCRETVLEPFALDKVTGVIHGGSTRSESVYLGLRHMGATVDLVVIHDGARPLLSPGLLQRLLEAGTETGAVIPVIPVTDTVKQVSTDRVVRTLERRELARVQTPQVFWYDLIWTAYRRAREAGVEAADDAALVERLRHRVAVVAGEEDNLKITTRLDFLVAEAILAARARTDR